MVHIQISGSDGMGTPPPKMHCPTASCPESHSNYVNLGGKKSPLKSCRWGQFMHAPFDLWILLEINGVKSKPLTLKIGPKYIWIHKQQ